MTGILIILLAAFLLAFIFTYAAMTFFLKFISGKKSGKELYRNISLGKTDIGNYVNPGKQGKGKKESDRQRYRIIQNALDFSRVRLRECMVPRTEIEAIECGSPLEELRQKFIGTQHSRILVYHKSIDNIIGYFELKEIFKNHPDIKSGIRKLAIVPETMAASKLLKVFVEEKKSIALVVDEFGGTSGIVTIEDLLEEIVGDIEDEHDTSELTEKVLGNNEFIFSGRLEIDYLNEKYNLGLPGENDYETLAGMILYFHGSIPGMNDVIRVRNYVFRVLKVTATRLELVNLKIE
jgi:CBS domain containing-hemolysin-like protein